MLDSCIQQTKRIWYICFISLNHYIYRSSRQLRGSFYYCYLCYCKGRGTLQRGEGARWLYDAFEKRGRGTDLWRKHLRFKHSYKFLSMSSGSPQVLLAKLHVSKKQAGSRLPATLTTGREKPLGRMVSYHMWDWLQNESIRVI